MSPFPDDAARQAAQTAHEAARNAHFAARQARRAARGARMRAHGERAPWFFGSLMIAMGLLFLLDNLNVIEARWVFRNLWPLLIMAFGLSRLIWGIGGERVFGALATAFGSLWLVDRLFNLDINVVGVFWPLLLIGIGISMIFRPRLDWHIGSQPPEVPPVPPVPGAPPVSGFAEGQTATASATSGQAFDAASVDQSARLKETAVLASVERRNVSQVFRGGELTAIMGSVEMDLRDCRMADPTTTIVVQVIMGQVSLRLPPQWTVESHLGTFLGQLEDRSDRPLEAGAPRLILYGSVFMGQVEIRN